MKVRLLTSVQYTDLNFATVIHKTTFVFLYFSTYGYVYIVFLCFNIVCKQSHALLLALFIITKIGHFKTHLCSGGKNMT